MFIKRLLFLLLMISSLAGLSGQPQSRFVTAGTGWGIDIPVFNASFRDYWNHATNVNLESQIFLSSRVAFCPRAAYHYFGLNKDQLNADFGSSISGSGGKLDYKHSERKAWEIGGQFQWFFSHPENVVGFYLTGGGSYCAFIYEKVEGVFKKDDQAFSEIICEKKTFHSYGPHGGFGLEFWLHHRLCFYSEAQLFYLLTTLSRGNTGQGKLEQVVFHDSKQIIFVSVHWGFRIDL